MRATVVRRIQLTRPRTVEFLSWSADSRRIVVGSILDARVGVYDVETGERLPGPEDRIGGVRALAHSPDGRYLAASVNSRHMQVWDLEEVRRQLRSLGLDWVD